MTQRERKQRTIKRDRLSVWLDDASGEQTTEVVLVGEPAINRLHLTVYNKKGEYIGGVYNARVLYNFLHEAYKRARSEKLQRERIKKART